MGKITQVCFQQSAVLLISVGIMLIIFGLVAYYEKHYKRTGASLAIIGTPLLIIGLLLFIVFRQKLIKLKRQESTPV